MKTINAGAAIRSVVIPLDKNGVALEADAKPNVATPGVLIVRVNRVAVTGVASLSDWAAGYMLTFTPEVAFQVGQVVDVALQVVLDTETHVFREEWTVLEANAGAIAGLQQSTNQGNVEILAAINASPWNLLSVSRFLDDQTPIRFTWDSSVTTITGERSFDGGQTWTALAGAVAFGSMLGDSPEFAIAFAAADRPASAGQVMYRLTDGLTTRFISLHVSDPRLNSLSPAALAQIHAGLFEDADVTALINAIIQRIETDLDVTDVSVSAIATATRDAILNRLLAGNHDLAGSVGRLIQDMVTVILRLNSGLQADGLGGWQATEKFLELADAGGSESPPVIVVPVVADTPQRVQGRRIEVWSNEEITLSVPVRDDEGNTVDLTGVPLWFGVWDRDQTLAVNVEAIGTTQGFQVTIPKLPTANSAMEWALRRNAGSAEGISSGLFAVRAKPEKP